MRGVVLRENCCVLTSKLLTGLAYLGDTARVVRCLGTCNFLFGGGGGGKNRGRGLV